jgi:hypothetical protein
MNISNHLGAALSRVLSWLRGIWDAVRGHTLSQSERLVIMSIFARLEALEARATASDDDTAVEAAATAATAAVAAMEARVAALETEVGTPAPAPVPAA